MQRQHVRRVHPNKNNHQHAMLLVRRLERMLRYHSLHRGNCSHNLHGCNHEAADYETSISRSKYIPTYYGSASHSEAEHRSSQHPAT